VTLLRVAANTIRVANVISARKTSFTVPVRVRPSPPPMRETAVIVVNVLDGHCHVQTGVDASRNHYRRATSSFNNIRQLVYTASARHRQCAVTVNAKSRENMPAHITS